LGDVFNYLQVSTGSYARVVHVRGYLRHLRL